MFCSKCGKQLGDDMLFCPGCGSKVVSDAPPQAAPSQPASNIPPQANPQQTAYTPPYQTAPPQKAKKASKVPVIISAVVVIVVLFFTIPTMLSRGPGKFEKSLAGTWIASFANGEAQCRLHFDDSADKGSAMLARFDKSGNCIGYFEAIYIGEVTYTSETSDDKITSGVITMKNVSDKDNSDHDFELPAMTIQYQFDAKTNKLTLGSNYLSDYFTEVADNLSFRHMVEDDYYPKTGERYYDWSLFY